MDDRIRLLENCTLCPRKCGVNRLTGETGYCGQTADITAARAALHMWEEPCISGTTPELSGKTPPGSGAVFFSGCNMRCVFCQNHEIAAGQRGKTLSIEQLAEIFLKLQKKGAANINLVTPTHFIPQICSALRLAKKQGLSLPIIYNTGSYETQEALALLDGLVDIYLPDCKYFSSELSARYSNAPDYFPVASAAIAEMFRQVGSPVFQEDTGLMQRGVILRHLILPGHVADSKRLLHRLYDTYGEEIYYSLLNQYTPLPHVAAVPELNRRVTEAEYTRVVDFCIRLGMEHAFIQEGSAAMESFIPAFDYEGLD